MKGICFLGDSLGKGVVYDNIRNRYVLLKDSFANLFAEKENIQIKNLCKFGGTVNTGLAYLERQPKELETCDFVVFEYGDNDSDFNWTKISDTPDAVYDPATPLETFKSTYKAMIAKVVAMGKQVIALNLPPLDYNKYFNWISKDKNTANILRWLGGTSDFIYRWHEQYSNAVANIANSMKIPLVDIRSVFLSKRDYSDYLCDDGIHLNKKGHRLVADVLIDTYESNGLINEI